MKTIIHTFSLLLLIFAVITPAFAAGNAKKKKPSGVSIKAPKGVELTADQQTKLNALNKEFGPRFAACRKEASGIITADQKKARHQFLHRRAGRFVPHRLRCYRIAYSPRGARQESPPRIGKPEGNGQGSRLLLCWQGHFDAHLEVGLHEIWRRFRGTIRYEEGSQAVR